VTIFEDPRVGKIKCFCFTRAKSSTRHTTAHLPNVSYSPDNQHQDRGTRRRGRNEACGIDAIPADCKTPPTHEGHEMERIRLAVPVMSWPLALLFWLGCATSRVESSQSYAEGPLPHPPVLLIYDFAISPNEALAQAYGSEFASPSAPVNELARKTAQTLSEQLQKKLTKHGIHARRVDGGFEPRIKKEM
jgi:hypothetical protein